MRAKSRRGRGLQRKTNFVELRTRHYVFCEGKTEKKILEFFKREWRANLEAVWVGGVPKTVVRRAKSRKSELRAEKAKFAIYVVFDRDEHPEFDNSVQSAKAAGFVVGTSVPCIELWGVLLHDDCTGFINRHRAQKKLSKLDPNYCHEKHAILTESTLINWRKAGERAASLRRFYRQHSEPKFKNPVTYFDVVLSKIHDSNK